MHWIKTISLIMTLSMAVITDFKNYKVPNALIINGILMGFLFNGLYGNAGSCVDAFLGMIFPAVIFMCLYHWSMIGAGDIKLFMVCGSFLGTKGTLKVIVWSFIIGAVLSLLLLIKNRNLFQRLNFFTTYLKRVWRLKQLDTYYAIGRPKKEETLHFSLSIFLAVSKVLLF